MVKTWQQLAELAAHERDPDKLRSLIRELTEALDEKPKGIARPTSQSLSNRLLFVDDEEGIRATLPLLLQERGFDVRVAASVPEALSEMKAHKFDVLLSDLNIGEDGDGVNQRIQVGGLYKVVIHLIVEGLQGTLKTRIPR